MLWAPSNIRLRRARTAQEQLLPVRVSSAHGPPEAAQARWQPLRAANAAKRQSLLVGCLVSHAAGCLRIRSSTGTLQRIPEPALDFHPAARCMLGAEVAPDHARVEVAHDWRVRAPGSRVYRHLASLRSRWAAHAGGAGPAYQVPLLHARAVGVSLAGIYCTTVAGNRATSSAIGHSRIDRRQYCTSSAILHIVGTAAHRLVSSNPAAYASG